MILSPQEAAQELLNRRQARASLLLWCRLNGYEPAAHHLIIINELELLVAHLFKALVRGHTIPEEPLNLMVMTPPGSAKSTYISKLFPPWFLAQMKSLREQLERVSRRVEPLGILTCSHSADIAQKWGKAARNIIAANEPVLDLKLKDDSRAADEWELTNGCNYKAAGVNTGISGLRMHLGAIDDFCGVEADAGSKLFNENTWIWYENDFKNRLQPISAQILIANHRNEDDLCGRLMQREPEKWKIIRFRLIIENEEQSENDPLHRKVGDILWPEYFTREQVESRMKNPRASGIQQQEPSPAQGAHFTAEMLTGYNPNELPPRELCNVYGASDHAVRTKQSNDESCLGTAWFKDGILYIHPDLQWDRIPTDVQVKHMIRMMLGYSPLMWWGEKENISGSIGPFLRTQMIEKGCPTAVVELSHGNKDLMGQSQSIHGMCALGLVKFPKFAPWWQRAEKQLLSFPNAAHDDFVSFLSQLGKGLMLMHKPSKPQEASKSALPEVDGFNITSRSMRRQHKEALKLVQYN